MLLLHALIVRRGDIARAKTVCPKACRRDHRRDPMLFPLLHLHSTSDLSFAPLQKKHKRLFQEIISANRRLPAP